LRHMLNASREVLDFIRSETRASLDTDKKLVRALTMSIGIIGEATSRVSRELQDATPEIPWAQIIGMRNRLIHAYYAVDLDILWGTATVAIPPFISELEKLIPSEPDSPVMDE
jgi:uncharacterized protein with HEPN domain